MNNLERKAVLVVEQDRGLSRILSLVLSESGLAVTIAATGQEALAILAQDPGDAVVLELGLLDRNRDALLEWLRAHDGAPSWVVISSLDRPDAQRAYGPLGKHFMTKPFDPWELASLVRRLTLIGPAHGEMNGLKGEDDAS
jgi:DNA-binding response OmpR family regulator